MKRTLFKQEDAASGIPRDSEALMLLRAENVLRLPQVQQLHLTEAEQSELTETIGSPLCSEFNSYLAQINELEVSKVSGVGLADHEKTHFNTLTQSIADCRPSSTDTIPQIKVKVLQIKEKNHLIGKYKSVINLYKAYLKILNESAVWEANGLEDVKREWDTHRHFAACDSHELLSIYKLYTRGVEGTVRIFTQQIDSDSIKLSPNVKAAFLHYCRHVFQQLKALQAQAIQSMLLRLRLAERHCDIHFDDVMSYTVAAVEKVYGKRIIKEDAAKQDMFDEMRRWRRRGLKYQHVREFIININNFCDEKVIDSAEIYRRKIIRRLRQVIRSNRTARIESFKN